MIKQILKSYEGLCVCLTFSRSGSLKARASSLLSMTEAAATSRGVEPLIDGDAAEESKKEIFGAFHLISNV